MRLSASLNISSYFMFCLSGWASIYWAVYPLGIVVVGSDQLYTIKIKKKIAWLIMKKLKFLFVILLLIIFIF